MEYNQILQGDCLEVLSTLADNSIDALVTDPPAGIEFMGKEWDSNKGSRQAWIGWLCSVMKEVLRVLKPGAHGFVWALPRTSHWTATALEDAGFEIREKLYHIHGQGFPKSKNLGNGLGSALKPAVEEWILCRKPLSESSLEANYAKWGTGGLAIDACRIQPTGNEPNARQHKTKPGKTAENQVYNSGWKGTGNGWNGTQGRFPSNLLLSHSLFCTPLGTRKVKGTAPRGKPSEGQLVQQGVTWSLGVHRNVDYADSDGLETVQAWDCTEDCPIRLLDEQSGIRKSNARANCEDKLYTTHNKEIYSAYNREKPIPMYYDQGGASRYFQQLHPTSDDYVPFIYVPKASKSDRSRRNTHPTVKSTALMRHLARLVTPPNGVILDPFLGSASTAVSAIREGFRFIGIERDPLYVEMAKRRMETTQQNLWTA